MLPVHDDDAPQPWAADVLSYRPLRQPPPPLLTLLPRLAMPLALQAALATQPPGPCLPAVGLPVLCIERAAPAGWLPAELKQGHSAPGHAAVCVRVPPACITKKAAAGSVSATAARVFLCAATVATGASCAHMRTRVELPAARFAG